MCVDDGWRDARTGAGGPPPYDVNAKRASDNASHVYNVLAFGADPTGAADSTSAIQSVLNLFTNGSAGTANGTIYFPPGHYKVTNYLWYIGDFQHNLRIQGAAGIPIANSGSVIDYYGRASNLGIFNVMGGAGLVVDGIAFNCRSLAQYGVWIAATNQINATLGTAVSPGTQTVTPSNMTNIAVGSLLNIDTGVSNVEFVVVTATTSSTFTATFQKSHLATAQVGNSSGSTNTRFRDLAVYGVSGSKASGIAIGSPPGGQGDTMYFDDCSITAASRGGAFAAIQLLYGYNYQGFHVHGGSFWGFQYGWYGNNAVNVTIDSTVFLAITTAFISAADETLTVTGTHAEKSTGMFLQQGLVGTTTLIGNEWETNLSKTNDLVISSSSSLVLLNNKFKNLRTSSSLPKINPGNAFFLQSGAVSPTEVFSSGNYFMNTPAGYAPFYDYLGTTPFLPRHDVGYGFGTVTITSLNDTGNCGISGDYPSCHLNNFVPVTFLGSTASADIAGSGVLNVGDTECAVAFRDHANRADVNGLRKNTSDVVVLGGTPGVSATRFASTVATGTPPLSVISTTPVPKLSVGGNAATSTSTGLGGVTGSIGGSALSPGACASGTVSIIGASSAVAGGASVSATPNIYPGAGFDWNRSYLSSADVVTVQVCADLRGTPTASTYNVKVVK